MNFISIIKLVFRTLLARKGRSFLTILGIVIGVAGVIIIIALGAGAQSLVLGQVTKLGTNLLSVQPGKSNETGPPAQVFGVVITSLVNEDAEALRDNSQVPDAVAVNALVRGTGSITWQSEVVDTNFVGTDHYYPEVVDFTMGSGRFFDARENQSGDNVVVLGSSVSEQLFEGSGADPIGQVVKVRSAKQGEAGGVPLRVVGVVEKRGSAFFQDQDDQIFIPLKIAQEQVVGIQYLQAVNIKINSSENVGASIADVKSVMDQRHRIKQVQNQDYTVRNIADAVNILSTITNALRLFLTAMAAIALVVGGIGILNIMLATVAERTREIGLRKAVGADNGAIRNQFLLEAGALTLLGGVIGIVVGVVVSYVVSLAMKALGFDWAFVISLSSVAMAVGVSILTGVFFGLYPAFKAAKLNPIEALRYE
jgi:ABC-type antimicrobial peptide transport system permease subunit